MKALSDPHKAAALDSCSLKTVYCGRGLFTPQQDLRLLTGGGLQGTRICLLHSLTQSWISQKVTIQSNNLSISFLAAKRSCSASSSSLWSDCCKRLCSSRSVWTSFLISSSVWKLIGLDCWIVEIKKRSLVKVENVSDILRVWHAKEVESCINTRKWWYCVLRDEILENVETEAHHNAQSGRGAEIHWDPITPKDLKAY